jgi:ParB family chromosome partitioning protein
MSSKFQNDAIFWVEVEKIKPNPYQPRRNFNEERLRDLAESIRQYGVLQPLTVTRKEYVKEDGGLKVEYELIAGERRHRASQLANLSQVPVIIRSGEEDSQVKLELAIIENLQREDLNPVERAEAFSQLAEEFEFTHKEIAKKIGKSREYVSNSMRLLKLPEEIKQAIINGQMTEGHARPIMMLRDKPEHQETLFKEVVHKGLTVREAESIARRDAQDKVRKKKNKIKPETKQLEDRLSDTFGTRVKIEERDVGGKLVIDFFSEEDLENIIKLVKAGGDMEVGDMMEQYVESIESEEAQTKPGTEGNETDSKSDESTGGKSMAETLGTMIAAARKQHTAKGEEDSDPVSEAKVENISQNTEAANPEYQDNQDEVGQNTQASESYPESDSSAIYKESEMNKSTPESSTLENYQNKQQDNLGSEDATHQPEPKPDMTESVDMNTQVQEDRVSDENNEDIISEPSDVYSEPESSKINAAEESSVDTGENTHQELSDDKDETRSTEEDAEPEEVEETEEEEMYSVSNFSI